MSIAVNEPMTQTERANLLRASWDELWKLSPTERRSRIDEILRKKEPTDAAD